MDILQKLISQIDDNLPVIQQGFDYYQEQFFKKKPPEFFCLELNGEAGELANLEKKLWKGRTISEDDLSDEAADVFIALINYCNSRNINLSSSLIKKLKIIEEIRLSRKEQGLDY